MKSTTKSLLAIAALGLPLATQAITFNTISDFSGNTSLSAGGGNAGHMFTVTSAINISDVGIFDDSAIAGLSSAGSVSIVSLNNNNVSSPFPLTVLGSYVVPAGTTDLNGGYSYVPTGGLVLGPGSYAIYVTSLDAADTIKWFSSTPSFAGNVGLGYSGDISGSLAAGIVGIGSRYEVANFRYSVPEPETYAMVAGVGLVAFGLWRRRQ